jgi:threonyl-tRNA synthetase
MIDQRRFNAHCHEIKDQLAAAGLRGSVDDRSETIGKKIRDNELKKIPFILIVGEKEVANHNVSLREHGKGDQGSLTIVEFADKINSLVA